MQSMMANRGLGGGPVGAGAPAAAAGQAAIQANQQRMMQPGGMLNAVGPYSPMQQQAANRMVAQNAQASALGQQAGNQMPLPPFQQAAAQPAFSPGMGQAASPGSILGQQMANAGNLQAMMGGQPSGMQNMMGGMQGNAGMMGGQPSEMGSLGGALMNPMQQAQGMQNPNWMNPQAGQQQQGVTQDQMNRAIGSAQSGTPTGNSQQ